MLPQLDQSNKKLDQSDKQRTYSKVVDIRTKEPVQPHVKSPLEDINWIRSQLPCVKELWLDCVAVEQFGRQTRRLETKLSRKSFQRAKAVLEEQGLFRFEPMFELSPSGRSKVTGWKVENLHGYYVKSYWEVSTLGQNDQPGEHNDHLTGQNDQPSGNFYTGSSRKPIPCKDLNFPNHVSTTPQLPTKVVGGGVRSSDQAALRGGVLSEDGGVTCGD